MTVDIANLMKVLLFAAVLYVSILCGLPLSSVGLPV